MLGNISEERFQKMSADYETEQKTLKAKAVVLKKALDIAKEQTLINTNRFLALSDSIRRYQSLMLK